MTAAPGDINPYASPGDGAQDSPEIAGPDAISFAGDINEALAQQAAALNERAIHLGWWVIFCLILAPAGAAANLILSGDVTWALSLGLVFVWGLAGLLQYSAQRRGKIPTRPPIALGPFTGAASPVGIDLRFQGQAIRLEWESVLGQMADAEMVLLYSGRYAACFAFPRGAFRTEADWGNFCGLVARKHVPRA
jgi:hypothetical protein